MEKAGDFWPDILFDRRQGVNHNRTAPARYKDVCCCDVCCGNLFLPALGTGRTPPEGCVLFCRGTAAGGLRFGSRSGGRALGQSLSFGLPAVHAGENHRADPRMVAADALDTRAAGMDRTPFGLVSARLCESKPHGRHPTRGCY